MQLLQLRLLRQTRPLPQQRLQIFLLVLLVCPVLLVVFQRPQFPQFRYFIVCFPFFYLLLAVVFSEWFGGSEFKKLLPLILAVAMTAGHLIKIQKLLSAGRGNYRAALSAMAAATDGPVIQVGSDHDFRNKILLDFYARYLPPTKRLRYIAHTDYGSAKPDWIIVHTLDPDLPAYPDVEVDGVGRYDYFGRYPYCGQSGWCWFVYRATGSLGK
jgi:hypothetical protein